MARSHRRWDAGRHGRYAADVAHVGVNGIKYFETSSRAEAIVGLANLAQRITASAQRAPFVLRLNQLFEEVIQRLDGWQKAAAPHQFGLKGTSSYDGSLSARQDAAAYELTQVEGRQAVHGLRYRQVYEEQVIIAVAGVIEAIEQESAERRRPDVTFTEGHDVEHRERFFVRRPSYEAAFVAALDRKARIIAFVGAPGVGKGRLVRELINRMCGTSVDVIFFTYDHTFPTRLALTLRDRGGYGRTVTANNLAQEFISFISSKSAPDYIVLTDLDDPTILDSVEPAKLRGTLVVTSAYHFGNLPYVATIMIRPLQLHEAMDLGRNNLPHLPDAVIQNLVETVGRSPQMIENAAQILTNASPREIDEQCQLMARTVMPRIHDVNLLQRFTRALNALRDRQPDVASALEYAALLGGFPSVELVIDALASAEGIEPEDKVHYERVARRTLQILNDQSYAAVDERWVRLTKLTRLVVRHILRLEGGVDATSHLRALLSERIAHTSNIRDAYELINHLFHVENLYTTTRDQAGHQVAKILNSIVNDPASAVSFESIKPLVDIDNDHDGLLVIETTITTSESQPFIVNAEPDSDSDGAH